MSLSKSIEVDEGGGGSCRNLLGLGMEASTQACIPRLSKSISTAGRKFLRVSVLLEHVLFSSVLSTVIELPLSIWIMWQYSLLATLDVQRNECDCFIKSF